jgi:hypothetical protein
MSIPSSLVARLPDDWRMTCFWIGGTSFALGVVAALLVVLLVSRKKRTTDGRGSDEYRWVFLFRAWVVAVFIVISALSVIIYRMILVDESVPHPNGRSVAEFGFTFLVELAAATFAYWFSYYWVVRSVRESEMKRQLEAYVVTPLQELLPGSGITEHWPWDSSLGWDQIIGTSKKIDLCVQGWDSLMKRYRGGWINFFGAGGVVHLFLPDLDIPEAKEQTIFHMSNRMKRGDAAQMTEIEKTASLLKEFSDEAKSTFGRSGHIVIHPYKPMIWYCLLVTDDSVAYLSVYEHCRKVGIDSPVYRIELARCKNTRKWIQKELDGMTRTQSTPKDGEPAKVRA